MSWQSALSRLTPETVAEAARRWKALSPTLVNPGVNHVYRAEDESGPLYLRFTHADLRDADYLAPPLAWLRHLHGRGAPVNGPLKSRGGEWIESFQQGDDLFFATAVRGIRGPRLSELPPTSGLYRAFGRAIGGLHAASRDFLPPPGMPNLLDPALPGVFPSWRLLWRRAGEHARKDSIIGAAYEELTPWVDAVGGPAQGWPEGAEPALPDLGLTHGDLRPGNAILSDERVVIIDFDEPVFGPRANDLARAVMEVPCELRGELWAALLAGYREAMPLEPYWDAELPRLLMARAVLMAAWSLEDGEEFRPVSGSGAPVSLWQLREHLRKGEYGEAPAPG